MPNRTVEEMELFLLARAAFDKAAVSHSKVWRIVDHFRASHSPCVEFGAWVTTYADPTGETAVARVLRERPHGKPHVPTR